MAEERVHKTLRLSAKLAERADGVKAEGETDTQLYVRLIEAGLEALEASQREGGTIKSQNAATPTATDATERIAELKSHIASLQSTVDVLQNQLAVKDGQIASLTDITATAQELHKASDVMHALQQPRKGLLASIADRFKQPRKTDL